MSLRVHRNQHLTSKLSDTVDQYDQELTYNKNTYHQKLKDLKKYKSPANIFYDIDTLFLTFSKIKREYTSLWKTHQSYKNHISSFLQSDVHIQISSVDSIHSNNITNQHNTTQITPPALQDISLFISELNNITYKFNDWIKTLLNKSQHILHNLPTKPKQNKKKLPFLSLSPEDSIFNVEDLTEFISPTIPSIQKRKTAPINHKQSQSPTTSMSSMSKSKSHETKDRNIRPSHAKRVSQTLTNGEFEINKIKGRKHKKNKKKTKKKRRNTDALYNISSSLTSQELSTSEMNSMSKHRSRDSVNSLLSISTFSSVKSTSSLKSTDSQRGSIIRSFGDLYEKPFIETTARNYAKRLEMIDEKSNVTYNASNKQLKMVKYYASQIYGKTELFESPFGVRPVVYCNWMDSGKSLKCIENYLTTEMMTMYGKHHDNITITGLQTSKYQQEARSIILESVQGQSEQDVVLFCGNGAVDCIYKMANVLRQSFIDDGNEYIRDCFVVFISIYECDNNILIWKEMGCKIVVIPEYNEHGRNNDKRGIDLKALETNLKFYSSTKQREKYKLLIGSFTAASNVTGVILPIDQITQLLHKYNALSLWDYEYAGPSMDILMTCIDDPLSSKDAIFISAHKYLGGPGSPGILCAKKKLFNNFVPVIPGNGTTFISYGHEDTQYEYLDNIEEREEVDTLNVIGCVRASLCFMIKDYLSTQFIINRENNYLDYCISELSSIQNLTIMGNIEMDRLPIISIMITHSQKKFGNHKTKYLHYNFISALMNDLFGIQGKGGTFNAGKYAMKCMDLNDDEIIKVTEQIKDFNNELARPGMYRINLHYTLNKEEIKYIINAIKYICKNGWYFLPLYDINSSTGTFSHRYINKNNKLKKQSRSLLEIIFDEKNGKMTWKKKHMRINDKALKDNFNNYFKMADDILMNLEQQLLLFFTKEQFKNEENVDTNSWYWLPSQLYDDCIASFK